MSSENVILGTIKAHGLSVGDRFNFHGFASDPFPAQLPTRVELGKVGGKYMLTTVTGDVHTWEFGPSAKLWADTTIKHLITTGVRTLDNGDTVYTAECEHGWMTGFHTSRQDAYDVAEGHGEVARPLYVPAVSVEDMTEEQVLQSVTGDTASRVSSDLVFNLPVPPVAEITGAEVEMARVAVKENGRVFAAEVHNFGGQAAFDILIESGTHTLINDGDMSRYIRTMRTTDGEPITDGMAVWDYNLDAGRVVLASVDRDGWFNVDTINAGRSLMNAKRVSARHPYSKVAARDAVAAMTSPGIGAIADDLVEADARHAAALAAEVSPVGMTNAWGPCGPCDGTDAPMARKAHPCGLMSPPLAEIHTGDGTVITEDDVKARVREAFGPSADQVTEDVWTGAGVLVTASGKALWAETRNGVTRVKGFRGGFTEWDAVQLGELFDLGVLSRPEVRLSAPVRALVNRRKRKATKVGARRVRGGF